MLHGRLTCGGMANKEVFTKALFWNLFNAVPFYKVRMHAHSRPRY